MTEENQSSAVRKHNNKWRVVDIVVAAIIAVASGVIFWGWDIVCTAPLALFEAVTPGFEGLLNAFWLFAGPLAAIIVRKPGAALFANPVVRRNWSDCPMQANPASHQGGAGFSCDGASHDNGIRNNSMRIRRKNDE